MWVRSELTKAVDELTAIDIPYEGDAPIAALDRSFRAVVHRLAAVRRDTLADD
jgi:hypothetical protein